MDTEADGHRVAFNQAFKEKGMWQPLGTKEHRRWKTCKQTPLVRHQDISQHHNRGSAKCGGTGALVAVPLPRAWISNVKVQLHSQARCTLVLTAAAGLDHEWDLELYGKLLEIGGGKERMTAYFSVSGQLDSQELPPGRAHRRQRGTLLRTPESMDGLCALGTRRPLGLGSGLAAMGGAPG